MKYNVGFTRDKNSNIQNAGYPEWWVNEAAKTKPNMIFPPKDKK